MQLSTTILRLTWEWKWCLIKKYIDFMCLQPTWGTAGARAVFRWSFCFFFLVRVVPAVFHISGKWQEKAFIYSEFFFCNLFIYLFFVGLALNAALLSSYCCFISGPASEMRITPVLLCPSSKRESAVKYSREMLVPITDIVNIYIYIYFNLLCNTILFGDQHKRSF